MITTTITTTTTTTIIIIITNVRIFRIIILNSLFFNFLYKALVLYNTTLAALAKTPTRQNPVLLMASQQMTGFIHWPAEYAVLALPGQNMVFVLGAIILN